MTEKINDGGQAFPYRYTGAYGAEFPENGMSLRDYFAGQALIELVKVWHEGIITHSEVVAEMSYEYADAMIFERSKHDRKE